MSVEARGRRVLVVGGGPGGMAAGIWCVRLGLRPRIVETRDRLGGQLRRVFSPIPDYPGIPDTDGPRLAERFAAHVEQLGIPVQVDCAVSRLEVEARRAHLSDGTTVEGQPIVLATGVARRRLDVPGERRLRGRGLSDSVSRELGSVGAREVAVIGGGDAAFEGALMLRAECEVIHLVHRGDLRARPDFRAEVAADPRIVVHAGAEVLEVEGDDAVTGLRLLGGERIPCARVFVRIGVEPRVIDDGGVLPRDDEGYLAVDRHNRCAEGIYAVGDVCSPDAMSVSVAVGHAMIACKHIQVACEVESRDPGTGERTPCPSDGSR